MGLIIASLLLFNLAIENYLGGRLFNRIEISVAITALLAAGEAVVIIARQVDLSVGSIVGMSAFVTGDVLSSHPGMPAVLAVCWRPGSALRSACSTASWSRTRRCRRSSSRWARSRSIRAVLTSVGGGQTIVTADLPKWVVDLPRNSLGSVGGLDIRLMFVIALRVAIVLQIVSAGCASGGWCTRSDRTRTRHVRRAAQARITVVAFVVCGALAGLAGFMFLGQFGTVNVTAGATFELSAIAAAVVGGVSIQGGSGTVIGAFLGAILIEILDLSLVRVPQVSEFWRDAVLGALILAAIILDLVVNKRFRRRRAAARASHRDRRDRRRCVTGRSSGAGRSCSRRCWWHRSCSTSCSPTAI